MMGLGLRALHFAVKVRAHCTPSAPCLRRTLVSVAAAELQFGQPLHETHPHLLQAGEVTPGISALEYAHRRSKLAKSLPVNSIAILAAADLKYRSGSVFYKFHQDPDFLYVTGFNEPESLAIIEKLGEGDEDYDFHLYVRPKDAKAELWDGPRSGVQAAEDVFNADRAGDVNHLPKILPEIIRRSKEVYTDLPSTVHTKSQFVRYLSGFDPSNMKGLAQVFRDAEKTSVKPLRPIMNEIRVVKSEAEIRNMRTAGQVSGRAITEAMRNHFSGEKDLDAFLDYRFKMHGCDGPAYVPVIAGGENALTIHYVRNDASFKGDELVLVDAGAEYGGYITDITRSWPTNGKFTDPQRDLYEMILKVQRSCVSLCREDADVTLDKLHNIASNGLKDGLKQLGFNVSGNATDILFPHHVGHFIGLDVHDSPGHPRNRRLEAGQCITIEPGIYVPNDERWPIHFRGIGIRIEDSICIQPENPLVFTTEAVKEIVDIEALRD
ncbi:putative Xaa-Pro aminopeptidase [Lepidopterella palustris CBS 459.81]|uniref:Xaa-Pro aminopeptidase n=1 Tax=Lepidopterella palustris CBS 459.81 TaxID=1314670 RepID=A0A8E2E1Q5_9PEZI|nr:putative Xaa-Pro aminopeptidase [Lepidopterella palustris CBS 459.81]